LDYLSTVFFQLFLLPRVFKNFFLPFASSFLQRILFSFHCIFCPVPCSFHSYICLLESARFLLPLFAIGLPPVVDSFLFTSFFAEKLVRAFKIFSPKPLLPPRPSHNVFMRQPKDYRPSWSLFLSLPHFRSGPPLNTKSYASSPALAVP